MRRLHFLLLLLGLATSGSALAEPIAPEILAAQYQACLAQIANNNDGIPLAAKQEYCACVRDTLGSKWDTSRLSNAAQRQGGLSDADLADINSLGRGCVMKALR